MTGGQWVCFAIVYVLIFILVWAVPYGVGAYSVGYKIMFSLISAVLCFAIVKFMGRRE
jgi:hypothetical protein